MNELKTLKLDDVNIEILKLSENYLNNKISKESFLLTIESYEQLNLNEIILISYCLFKKNIQINENAFIISQINNLNINSLIETYKSLFDKDEWDSYVLVSNTILKHYIKDITKNQELNAYLFNLYLSISRNHVQYYKWKKDRNHKKLINNELKDFQEIELNEIIYIIFKIFNIVVYVHCSLTYIYDRILIKLINDD